MNVKKIIKGIIGLGAIGGVAYAAYKLGECSGEVNERFREKYGDEDDECLAPKKQNMPTFSVSMHNFASLDSVHVDGISDKDMDMLVYHISLDKYTSNKQIREWLEVDRNTASKVIAALRKAGYVGDEHSNYIIPVYITTEVYFRLRGDLH